MADLLHPLPDAAERDRAASEFGTSFVVLAGAGTGKTSLLVERLLTAIGAGRLEIGQIAAITFTEKASGEMRQRLADGLEKLRRLAKNEAETGQDTEARRAFGHLTGGEGHDPGRIAAHALAALEQLDHATVQTIHAFCAELLRRYPLEAGVEPDFTVDTGEYEARLREPAWNEFITHELGPEAPRPDLWRRLLAVFGVDDLREAAFALAGFHIPGRLLELPFDPPPVEDLFADKAGALADSVEDLLSRARGMTPRTSAYFSSVARALRGLVDQGLDAFKTQVSVSDEIGPRIEAGKAAPKANKKLEGVAPELLDRLSKQSLRFVRNLSRTDDASLLELLEGLAPFALDFRERLLASGFVSFDGLLALTRDLLRDHPDVRGEIKRRYKALLVDEFQDTDPLQYEIVLFLAEQPGAAAADPYLAPLERGRLFIVGDAKQSIYRFRGADYAAYRAAIDRVLQADGQQLKLAANFRSEAGLLEPVNRLFSAENGVWQSSDYQPEYVPIQAARDGEVPVPNVEIWTVELGDDLTADRRREAEGQVLAREIERLVREQQACRYRDISILLRAFTQLSPYLRPLRERGVPFIVDGGKEFMKRPEVAQLMAILRALSQPSDPAALLAFLRSPAGGVPDTELTEYARAGGCWNWQSEVDERRFGLIAGRFELLRGLAREMRDLPADAVIRRVVEATCLLPLNAVAFEGAQRVANLGKLAAAAGGLARDGKLSLEEVTEALREGGLSNFEADSPLADDADDAVRICTIHKMKGLENRIVFLPDLAREDRPGRSDRLDVGAVRLPEGRQFLALKVGELANSVHIWKDEEDRLHEEAEEIRVLYVAMTRAKQRLVVVAGRSRRDSLGIEALRAWGYSVDDPPADGATLVGGSVLHRQVIPEAPSRQPAGNTPPRAESAVGAYESAVEKLTAAAAPVFRSPSGSREESELALRPHERESALRPGADRGAPGKAVGILLHRWLERWNGKDQEDLRDTFRGLCRAVATAEDVDPQDLEREGGAILEKFLAGPLAQRFREVTHVGRELPMLLRDPSGTIYRGSIDLLYRDGAGDPIIADYKTDRETDESALRERYREQLGIYADAVRQALDLPRLPRAELWSLRTGHRIAIDWNETPSR